MFSDLYYLSTLMERSLAFSDVEKIQIFNFAEKNPKKITTLIKALEDEQTWIKFIKNNYKKNLVKIWENLKNNLLKKEEELKKQQKEKNKRKLIKMKVLEQKEKENLDLLFNEI